MNRVRAFTLLEGIVVLAVVAILVSLAVPAFVGHTCGNGREIRSMANAKQISLALKNYALDFNGAYPRYTDPEAKQGHPTNSNEILKTLIPDYISDEIIFAVRGSAWSKPGPDGNITAPNEMLKAGENAWFYIAGLHGDDPSRWPVLATAPKPGTESDPIFDLTNEKAKGGVWKGNKAVVLRCDGSANIEMTVKKDEKNSYVTRDGTATAAVPGNALKYDPIADPSWLKPEILPLNPL